MLHPVFNGRRCGRCLERSGEKYSGSVRTENTGAFKAIKDVLIDVYDNIEQLHHHDGDITGIPTGFRDLDQITSGFQRNDLIIIAARPSVGKTAFALNIAQNVAIKTNENAAIFSLEMGADQLVSRMLCAEGNIDAQRLRTGKLEDDDWSKLTMAMGSLSNAGILLMIPRAFG